MKKLRVVAVCVLLFSMLLNIMMPLQVVAETRTTESEANEVVLADQPESTTDQPESIIDSQKESNEELTTVESDQTIDTSDSQQESIETEELVLEDESSSVTERADIGTYTTVTGSPKISEIFPDPNLAVVVANTLGYKGDTSRTVNQTKLNSITILSADSISVSSIEGIQYLNGATKISFENSLNIENLNPLAGASLSKLKQLYFKNNRITDLTPLATAGLTALEELYVEDNELTSLTGIEAIKTLKTLSFQNSGDTGNTVTSLDPLSKLTALQTVFGKSNKITSLQPLANLSSLTGVFMESNQLTSIVGMENKPNLTDFSIMYQQVEDLTPIASSTALVNLYIRENNISSVEPLKNLTKVTTLLMENNHVIDLSPLSKLTGLTLFLANDQTWTLPKAEYSTLVPFELENAVKTRNGSLVSPATISDSGSYGNPTVSWNLPSGVTEVSYTWTTTSPAPGEFSGTIIQPLDEQISVDFTISNTIVSNPNPNETVAYTVQLVTAEGKIIAPSKNGLSTSSSDATLGTFSLATNESITLKGTPNATYKVVEDIDATVYNARFGSVHDAVELVDQPLPSDKTVIGHLAENVNTLDFLNKYKAKLVIENHFNPSTSTINSAVYDIIFTYPDGSTSTTQYTGKMIQEGQPFEEMLEVGTTYQITQQEVSGYEPSVEVTADGLAQAKKFGEVSGQLLATGTIGVDENKLSFENVKTEKFEITTKDTSKYPNINQNFEYVFTFSKPDSSKGTKYLASKYNGNTLVETYEVDLGQPSSVILLKDGERLIFSSLPVDIQFSVEQKGVSNYITSVSDSPANGTVTGGGMGNGAKIDGNMEVGGNSLVFANHSEYIPPTTGINKSGTIAWVSIIIAIVCLAGYILQWRIRHS